jgi:hypothetical protein
VILLLLKDFGLFHYIGLNVIITVDMEMLFQVFGPSRIICMTMCVYFSDVPVIHDGQFTRMLIISHVYCFVLWRFRDQI